MKIVVVSPYFSFHQNALWDEFSKHKDVDLIFLATGKNMMESRLKMGYQKLERDYVVSSLERSDSELETIFKDCDIAFVSFCKDDLRVDKYLKDVPIYIPITEHLSKHHTWLKNTLGLFKFLKLKKHYYSENKKYVLCASSRAYNDFQKYGYKGKGYRFGYFPELNMEVKTKDPYSLVWYGRVLSWKRVDYVLKALRYFREKENRYHLTIIGEGDNLDNIKKLATRLSLEKFIDFRPFLKHEEMMELLPTFGIQMFTSDNGEGWGVALNEGLASRNICFCNEKAGATKFLIENEVNGYIFNSDSSLKKAVNKYLALNELEVENMRAAAFKTIDSLWNYKVAADRLYEFVKSVYNNQEFDKYQTGPLSKIK